MTHSDTRLSPLEAERIPINARRRRGLRASEPVSWKRNPMLLHITLAQEDSRY